MTDQTNNPNATKPKLCLGYRPADIDIGYANGVATHASISHAQFGKLPADIDRGGNVINFPKKGT